MNSLNNKKSLEVGYLVIDETMDFNGKNKNVTFIYYLNEKDCGTIDWKSKIDFEIQMYDNHNEIKKVRIWDFLSREVDKGYGTIVLQEFFRYLKKQQKQPIRIVGYLSECDEKDNNNRQRRDHIYQKFGFKIEGKWVEKIL